MQNELKESNELKLLSKFSKEYILTKKEKIFNYVDKTININKNVFYCFILIKYQDNILYSITKKIKSDKDFQSFKENILNKIKNINLLDLKKSSIKIFIVEDIKDNKNILYRFKKEFCRLTYELNLIKNRNILANYINSNFKYIFSLIITVFMLIFIIKFSNLGILINFLSFETLTIVSNSIIFYLILLISMLFLFSLIAPSLILMFQYFFNNLDCNTITELRELRNYFTLIFLFFIIVIQIQEIFYVIIKNDRGLISDFVVRNYISQTREPSLVTIKYKEDNNINEKTILLMGKDNNFIYYLNLKDFHENDDIKSKIIDNICSNNKKETLSYINSLITLLNIKQKDWSTNFIANQRYHNLKISDISFSKELPDFYESFCK
ncbi:hypothetical protein [Aliarcobacter butzleri]|uniref:hypothetical protein n=1 Tax=Aliarcobacter butzleri TaxID=28197 RepID=UPI003B221586